jgi:hypothetical protein
VLSQYIIMSERLSIMKTLLTKAYEKCLFGDGQ